MKIPRHNWDAQRLEYDEYPDALFEPFLVWLLTTSAWYEDPARVRDHVLALKRQLNEFRSTPDTHHEADAPAPLSREEALAAKRRASLAKARAAKKAAREVVHAEA
jgi:hypothetical protein